MSDILIDKPIPPLFTRCQIDEWKVKQDQSAPDDIQTIVKGQHEKVSRKVGNVVPHDVAFEASGGRDASLVNDPAQAPDDLPRDESNVGSRQRHGSLGHDLSLQVKIYMFVMTMRYLKAII